MGNYMRKHLLKSAAAALAVVMAVPSVPVPAQAAVKLSVSDCVLSIGDKLNLDVNGAKEKSGKYKSSKKKLATVTKDGVVTAKKTGNAKITWKKGNKKYTCKVKVVKAPVLSKKKLEVNAGMKETVTVNKYGNKKLTVTWTSSDKKIAKVSGGKITGISEGETVIKAKIKGYKKTWTRKVTVTVKGNGGVTTSTPDATNTPDIPVQPGTTEIPGVTSAPGTTEIPGATEVPGASATPGITAAPGTSASPDASATPYPGGYPVIKPSSTTSPVDETHKGYTLKWEEQFNGTSLNRDDWNVELHEPGWVNNELQEYVDSEKNIYVKDGNLVLKPVKTVGIDGKVSYTSGRINTQNKHNFKYGLFEARLKVPAGQGYLPAFWMMPANENLYGQWPRCGEIDIMEVLGNETKTSYGTIHYGNPHSESQGKHTLEKGNFSDEYHTFSVEWEPGKINWYVDGRLMHTENDWYSATEGQGEITYPAPFDQPFYIILNLAVGGNWPGNPDETTDFDKAAFMVDYVKVFQKDSYNEDVEKPEKEVILRDPDKDGNYVNNGNFQTAEDLADEKDWTFLTTLGGEAAAEIKDGQLSINTTEEGTADYSVQLVQPDIPMKKGATYKVKFDAYADEARTMKVDVSAPDRGYKRYLQDTAVELTTSKKTYEYEFKMTDKDDANGRLEYNLGATGSKAGVHISNVSIIKVSESTGEELEEKTVLADGNYVYNGSFQEGKDRKEYWDIDNKAGAEVSVTNIDNIRRLKVTAPEGTSADKPVIVSQDRLALTGSNNYALSFKAEGENAKNINVTVAGKEFKAELAGAEKEYAYKFTTDASLTNKDIVFKFSQPGTYYLDDVRVVEDSLIKNGSFNAGLAGYEVYVDGSADAACVVDSLTEDNAADFTINNTGDQDWKIQLKQNNIELEKGVWYKLSFDAKSSIARKIMFAIQRDGSADDDWTPYSGQPVIELGSEYKTYDVVFQMKNETDLKAVLSISMGAVGGTQISDKHRICIDNISLEKTDAQEEPELPVIPAGENILKNGDFAKGEENWVNAVTAPGAATVSFENQKAVYNITNVGTEDWNVQLKQEGILLEKGCTYKLTFKAASTEARTIKAAMLTAKYDWYGGQDIVLEKDTEKTVEIEFTVDKETDNNITMVISMGKIENVDTPVSGITLSDFKLIKVK